MARKYTHLIKKETEILAMRNKGKTHREIAEHYGLEKSQIKEFVKRHNRKQRKIEAGIVPLKRGRPRKDFKMTEEDKVLYYKRKLAWEEYDRKRLEKENKLLRDFLHLAGRK